jgi:hypothetical protein
VPEKKQRFWWVVVECFDDSGGIGGENWVLKGSLCRCIKGGGFVPEAIPVRAARIWCGSIFAGGPIMAQRAELMH